MRSRGGRVGGFLPIGPHLRFRQEPRGCAPLREHLEVLPGRGTEAVEERLVIGAARYVGHVGSRPISITWRLEQPLPAKLRRRMARLVAG
jgi:hypothetical protein